MLIFTYLEIYQISALLQRGLHWTSLQARTTALLIWPDCASWSDQSGDYITTQMNLASSGYCLLWPLVLDHRMKGFTRIQYSVSKMLSLMFCIHLDKHWPLSLIQCIFKMNELKGPVGGSKFRMIFIIMPSLYSSLEWTNQTVTLYSHTSEGWFIWMSGTPLKHADRLDLIPPGSF